jgi:hypothetical protein
MHYPGSTEFYEDRRAHLLNSLLKWTVALGGFAYVPSLLACIHDGLFTLAAIDTLAYAVLALVFFSERTTYHTRLVTAVLTTLLLGAAVLFNTGTDGAGHVWLICSAFVAALFGRVRVTVFAIAATQLIVILYAALSATGIIAHDVSAISLFAIAANMLLVSTVLALITFHLLESLRTEMQGQEDTLKLLDHRVKNNLQSIESLVAMHGTGSEEDDALSRRIRAVSAANELLLADPGASCVELDELLRTIADPTRVRASGSSRLRIPAERMTEVAIGISDLLDILDDAAPLKLELGREITVSTTSALPDPRTLNARLETSLVPTDWRFTFDTRGGLHTLHVRTPALTGNTASTRPTRTSRVEHDVRPRRPRVEYAATR